MLWLKTPRIALFMFILYKNGHKLVVFLPIQYCTRAHTCACTRARTRERFISFADITLADIVNIYRMNTTIHYIIVPAFRYPTFDHIHAFHALKKYLKNFLTLVY